MAKWLKSEEKKQLREDILSGNIDGWIAEWVYEMHGGIYKKFKFKNFSKNLRSLRLSIWKQQRRAFYDAAFYHSDLLAERAAAPETREKHWNTSEAKKLLEDDLDAEKHKSMQPKELWLSRPEYQEFGLEKFRNHIYKAVIARQKTAYWEKNRKS